MPRCIKIIQLLGPPTMLAMGLALAPSADAATYRVKAGASSNGPGTNPNWSDSFNNLQSGLAVAATGDEIWVAAVANNPYTPGTSQTNFFLMEKGVKVFGGFIGTETQLSDRNPTANVTILSADLSGDDNWGNPNYDPDHVNSHDDNGFTIVKFPNQLTDEIGLETVLDGFTIRGARNTSGSGGGIICSNAGPLIRGCTITDNRAAFNGGGLYQEFPLLGKCPELRNCTISSNHAGGVGGGVSCAIDTKLLNCLVETNKAERGAGVYVTSPKSFLLASCQVRGNIATDVTGNNFDAQGGGVHVEGTSPFGHAEFVNTVIADNQANGEFPEGGGVYAGNLEVQVSGCTISNNSATSPGGTAFAGGLSLYGSVSKVENSIVFFNTANFSPNIEADPGVKVNYSDIQGGWTGATDCTGSPPCNQNVNPLFVNASGGNYRLACGSPPSPCINAGSSPLVPDDDENVDEDGSTTEPTPDRDLKWRTMEAVDMGAYEKQPGSGCKPGDVSPSPCGNDLVDIDDLLVVVNTWLQDCDIMPCYGDANGNGIVDIDDLLHVINGWGSCAQTVSAPQTVQDCINICSAAPTTEEYQGCMNKCLLAIGEEP